MTFHPLLSLKVGNILRKYIKIFHFFLAREDNVTMYYFKGASHCNDMYSDEVTDSDDLRRARERIRDEIDIWIKNHNYISRSFLTFPFISIFRIVDE